MSVIVNLDILVFTRYLSRHAINALLAQYLCSIQVIYEKIS